MDVEALDEAGQAHLLRRLDAANAKLQRHIDSLMHLGAQSTAQQRPTEVHSSRLGRVRVCVLHLTSYLCESV